MIISCSTSWNSHRRYKGARMLEEINLLGFEYVELGHGIKVNLLPGIFQYLENAPLAVSSIHNFCPLPVEATHDSPDCLQFTSFRSEERLRAVRLTCETIRLAGQLGAPVVILHLGSVDQPPFEREIAYLMEDEVKNRKQIIKLKIKALRRREKMAETYWQRIFECLDPIVEEASTRQVRLGIECRASVLQFPLEQEFSKIWQRYPTEVVGYWHDFGHMQRKQNLNLGNHWEALSANQHRLFGGHVHDTIYPLKDHQPPGTGSVDWELLRNAINPDAIWVLELDPNAITEDLQKSAEFLSQWLEKTPASSSI